MTTNKLREEFETWAGSKQFGLSKGHFKKDENGEYLNYPTQCYWDVWQASRAAQAETRRLRDWIKETSRQFDICTYNVLKEICDGCRCKRYGKAESIEVE